MRKQILSFIYLIAITASSFSQVEKKTILLGAYGNIDLNTTDGTYFIFDPNSGIFIADRFCLGINLPIFYDSEDLYIGARPFVRFYLNKQSKKSLFFYSGIGLLELIDSDYNVKMGLISLGIGHVWFLNKNIGFETELIGSTNFDKTNIGIYFGFQIYLNKVSDK